MNQFENSLDLCTKVRYGDMFGYVCGRLYSPRMGRNEYDLRLQDKTGKWVVLKYIPDSDFRIMEAA